jgi:hypothetical protein
MAMIGGIWRGCVWTVAEGQTTKLRWPCDDRIVTERKILGPPQAACSSGVSPMTPKRKPRVGTILGRQGCPLMLGYRKMAEYAAGTVGHLQSVSALDWLPRIAGTVLVFCYRRGHLLWKRRESGHSIASHSSIIRLMHRSKDQQVSNYSDCPTALQRYKPQYGRGQTFPVLSESFRSLTGRPACPLH